MRIGGRRAWLRVLWFVLAVGLLWLTLGTVSLVAVWERLRQIEPSQLILLIAVNAFVLLTFSARWWLLLFALGYVIPYVKLVVYRLAAFAVSYFTPGPHFGGEPLQVYLVTTRHQVPTSASLTAVALDKVLEMLVNFTFLMSGVIVVLNAQTLPPALELSLFFSCLALLMTPAAVLALLWTGRRPASSLLVVLDGFWRRLRGRSEIFGGRLTRGWLFTTICQSEDQIARLCRLRPSVMLLALGVSVLSWLGIVGEFWLMTDILSLDLTLAQALTALLAARIAILLPLPAALGALEASQVIAMGELGLTPAAGVSLSLLIRSRDVFFGLLGLWILALLFWRRKGGGQKQHSYLCRVQRTMETADVAADDSG